ncbi:unnamed protein product [Brassicogethes aeneus]|uniref:tRNA (32-2'-O)-methyltransferase regulator THADA n=1 Tax=Brassicogethes aeneus TaxID=1431903 RepID=A0A9P0AY07_BRAAE|nr:unnamed protein product [Brassicogethes aeneus]
MLFWIHGWTIDSSRGYNGSFPIQGHLREYHPRLNFPAIACYEELMQLINLIFKQILSGFAKRDTFKNNVLEEYSIDFIKLSHEVLSLEIVSYDVKTKCGLILGHSLMILTQEELDEFKHKKYPVLELMENNCEERWIPLKKCVLKNILSNDSIKVIIYSAIFNVIPTNELLNIQVHSKNLVTILYEELIKCSKRTTSNPPQIVEVSRILSMIGKNLKSIPMDFTKNIFEQGLEFVWSHIDHFVDTVRSYTKLICGDLVELAYLQKNNVSSGCLDILLHNINSTSKSHTVWFVAIEQVAKHFGCDFVFKTYPLFQSSILSSLKCTNKDLACKTYISLMEQHFKETDKDNWFKIWILPLTNLLNEDSGATIHYQNILTISFKINPLVIRKLYGFNIKEKQHPNYSYYKCLSNKAQSCVMLKILKLARSSNVAVPEEDDDNFWRGLIDKNLLNLYKVHQDDEIRISVLGVIVESQKSTELFLEWEFDFLLSYLFYNISSQVPHIRKETITYYKHALARYEASYNVIQRNIKKIYGYNEKAKYYTKFLKSFTKLLIGNLARDANYPRRCASLELLLLAEPILKDDWIGCWNKDAVFNLQNILYDSYEGNKKMAVAILHKLSPTLMGFNDETYTKQYLANSISMAQDIKPSKTLSAAYHFQVCTLSPYFEVTAKEYLQNSVELDNFDYIILCILTEMLEKQRNKVIVMENLKTSQYGIILSINYLLKNRNIHESNKEFSVLFQRLVDVCLQMKNNIMPVVCNSSPEGYLPDNADLEIDESSLAQMVLVYAWRTMKELTLLLAEIVRQCIKLEEQISMLKEEVLTLIGQFFFNIFIESKHRGVFEQAYVGFSIISQAFWISRNQHLSSLPKLWLKEALHLSVGIKESDKLCATRRSAGLPFLILSIVSTDPSYNQISFHSTMKTLLDFLNNTKESNNEYKMHCLNILRALFRHSKLGDLVSSYVGQAVIVAITGFKSKIWGIRNSSTLLYSALLTRMFGVQRTQDSEDVTMKNRLTVRVFFMRYPELFQFILETLSNECEKSDSLVLHPVLVILARLYPSHIEEYNSQIEQYIPFISTCLANSVYKTRELAARASVGLICKENLIRTIENCLSEIKKAENDNITHGYLLQVFHLIKLDNLPENLPIDICIGKSLIMIENVGTKYSHLSLTLLLEIILKLLKRYPQYDNQPLFEKLLGLLDYKIFYNSSLITTENGLFQAVTSLTIYLLLKKIKINDSTFEKISNQIILDNLFSLNIYRKQYCQYFLIAINHAYYSHVCQQSILQTGELSIPQDIQKIVDMMDKKCLQSILLSSHKHLRHYFCNKFNPNWPKNCLSFTLLNYYPCLIKSIYQEKQKTVDYFVGICQSENDELIGPVISCIATLLSNLSHNVLKSLDYNGITDVLMQSASPAASVSRRLAVCQFLTKMSSLFIYVEEPILQNDNLINVFNILMVLLEDDDCDVRNGLSNLFLKSNVNKKFSILFNLNPLTPEKIKEDVLNLTTKLLPKQCAINFLFSWSCRHFPEESTDTSEIFERGELNLYAENIFTSDISKELLKSLLGKNIDNEINNMYSVTTLLLDSLKTYSSPMMSVLTKNSIINVLLLIRTFLKECFSETEFLSYYMNTVVLYIRKNLNHSEFHLVKKVFDAIYL